MQSSRPTRSKPVTLGALIVGAALLTGGCSREGELDVSSGVGVYASLDGCPVVGVPNGTGDVTLFDPAGARTADAIDIVANITNVRGNCTSGTSQVGSNVSFDVIATRMNTQGSRQVTLPYYSAVLQSGENVVAKQVNQVTLNFADGQRVASAPVTAGATVDAQLTRLSADVRARLLEDREPGDENAAIDPLSDPQVRDEVRRTTFEHLVGFQLTDEQLAYNVTR